MEKTFNITGMHCHACEMLIKESLIQAGAKVVNVSYKDGTVSVLFDETRLKEKQIKKVIEKLKYKVVE